MLRLSLSATLLALAACLTAPNVSAEESARFHHAHVNAVDPQNSIDWYQKFFSAVPVKYNDSAPGVFTDRSFILFNKVDEPAPWKLEQGIYHLGWGGVDGPSDFKWRNEQGVEWETPLSTLGNNYFMYAYGPDKEVVEVWTGFQHHRFGHVHLFADDVNATKHWYMKHLGLAGPAQDAPKPPKAPDDWEPDPDQPFALFQYMWTSQVSTDNDVTINIFAKPSKESIVWWNYDEGIDELQPSDGRAIDHIAFSYRDIGPVYDRMKADGVEIVRELQEDPELKARNFFVRGPDKVLVEIIEAEPIPEAAWE